MNVSHRRGRVRLHLEPVEIELLTVLLDDLVEIVRAVDADDPVTRRLYPSGYADADAAAEFRSLIETDLRDERLARIDACVADLATGSQVDLGDPDDARRWIQVLNDLRLAVGTRLGVTDDGPADPEADDDPGDAGDPDAQARMIYHWLTATQDSVVTRLMG